MSLFSRYGRRTTKDIWFRGEETLSRQWELFNDAIEGADGTTVKDEGWELWLARQLNTNNSYSHHEILTAFKQRKENPRTNYLSHGKRGGVVTRTKPFVGDEVLNVDEWVDSVKGRQYNAYNQYDSIYLTKTQIQTSMEDVPKDQQNDPLWSGLMETHRSMKRQAYRELQRQILQPVIQDFTSRDVKRTPRIAPGSTRARFYKEDNPVEFEAICQYKALQDWFKTWGTFNKRTHTLPSGECEIYSYQFSTYLDDFSNYKKQQLFKNMRAIDHTIPEPNWELLEAHQRTVNTSYSGRAMRMTKKEQELAHTQKNLDQWTNPLWVEEYVANQISTLTQMRNSRAVALRELIAEKEADELIINPSRTIGEAHCVEQVIDDETPIESWTPSKLDEEE